MVTHHIATSLHPFMAHQAVYDCSIVRGVDLHMLCCLLILNDGCRYDFPQLSTLIASEVVIMSFGSMRCGGGVWYR